ncbi:sugar phosphate isomerase/epimerase [Candidatus Bathyarchaeota archaeon]|nr:sugar phosphate isomerase/epimerase [Candidatus Bathyarchaeota archaeon]
MYVSIISSFLEELGYNDIVDGCYSLGVYAVELRGREWGMASSVPFFEDQEREQRREALLEQLKSNRIKISCINIQTFYFDHHAKPVISNLVDIVRKLFKNPHVTTRTLYLGPPNDTDPEISDKEYAGRVSAELKNILDKTADLGLEIALENHGAKDRSLGVKRDFLQMVLKYVNSERLGLTLDTGCFYWLYPLDEYYKITEYFLPYVKNVHLKNQTFPPEQRHGMKSGIPVQEAHDTLYDGDIDLRRVIKMLEGSGYDGALCIEDHSFARLAKVKGGGIEEMRRIIKRDIEFIRDIL